MPYIKQELRPRLDKVVEHVLGIDDAFENGLSEGELNYLISSILNKLLNKNLSYTKANALVGMLECVKLEFYRRAVAPYEDKKILENGDVYS